MNNSRGALLILSSILLSSIFTYLLTKAKYEKRPVVNTEVQAEPEKKTENKKEEKVSQEKQNPAAVTNYANKYKQQHAALVRGYSSNQEEKKRIEIIDADMFNTDPEYEDDYYTLYANNVLADGENVRITDIDDCVGRDTIEQFNVYEHNGIVNVRNHEYKLDIQIVRDLRTYEEAIRGTHRDVSVARS